VHGDCNVPKRYKANPQLGSWVKNQRKQAKLDDEKINKLNDIGFLWNAK
jgi:hypothetical protein